ncbi:hypothetical protein ARMGADRAFT_441932 [Armillaria gallica]|uniref:Uncharacterized protein n=1 Tax=Armillaria gallica TaxID=47427 RepID=A0A2H3DB47_ARMGA|nr:hypothetical protein ARMGADRAFT_441932 [Armillaria gallica]
MEMADGYSSTARGHGRQEKGSFRHISASSHDIMTAASPDVFSCFFSAQWTLVVRTSRVVLKKANSTHVIFPIAHSNFHHFTDTRPSWRLQACSVSNLYLCLQTILWFSVSFIAPLLDCLAQDTCVPQLQKRNSASNRSGFVTTRVRLSFQCKRLSLIPEA